MSKTCGSCKETKAYDAFYRRPRYREYPTSSAGYSNLCSDCTKEERRRYKEENKEKAVLSNTNSRLKRVYGIDLAVYNQMFADQKGCCPGCNRHQSELKFKLAVDHDHATNKVRGLLCINCNAILGQARDNVSVLQNLTKYLIPELAANSNVIALMQLTKVG